MNYLVNYLIFNLAIAVSYITARSTLEYCLNFQQLYKQRLKLARFALLAIIAAFWLMPPILNWLAIATPTKLQFQPFIRQASGQLLAYYTALPMAGSNIKQTVISLPDIDSVLAGLLLLAFAAGLSYQIKNAYLIIQLIKNSYQIRRVGRINILLNEAIQIPICFSFLRNSYVILPQKMIENHSHFKIAIAHELQHIRQKDTRWLYLLTLLKITCFANPFVWLWTHWINELQEFACDETLMQRTHASPVAYGQCLLDTAKNASRPHYIPNVLSLFELKKTNQPSNLYRRVNMLFVHRKNTNKGLLSLIAGILLTLSSISTAYALNGNDATMLSMTQLKNIVKNINSNSTITVAATPEVLAQVNTYRTNPKANAFMTAALQRMAKYQPMIQQQLSKRNMPSELLAIPLTESAYRNLDQSKNIVSAAGIWQVVPATAHRYGLVINDNRDDRLVPKLETRGALNYLQKLHAQFNDWNLALIAYEVGEDRTQQLINLVGSRNAWDLVHSKYASDDLKKYMPALNASMIIMRDHGLIS